MKKRLKLKKLNVLFLIIFSGLFIYSIYNIVNWLIDNKKIEKQMDNIVEKTKIVETEDTENTEIIEQKEKIEETSPYWTYIKLPLINVNFKELAMINKDVVGWINVNGTNINYPFVQTTNNTYYLTHAFDKTYNKAGWVFMDYRNDKANYEKNTILYGHARGNNTMFGTLKKIINANWYNNTNNHVVRLSTETENTLWQVFSVYKIVETNDYIQTKFLDDKSFTDFYSMLINRSVHNFNTTLNSEDKILTLSTCHGTNERIVLHAKLIKRETKTN